MSHQPAASSTLSFIQVVPRVDLVKFLKISYLVVLQEPSPKHLPHLSKESNYFYKLRKTTLNWQKDLTQVAI